MNTHQYDGIYWRWSARAAGFVVVVGNSVLSYPLWGTEFDLFDEWRCHDLRITLRRMYDLDLFKRRGESA